MKHKLLVLSPTLLGLFLASCGGTPAVSSASSENKSSEAASSQKDSSAPASSEQTTSASSASSSASSVASFTITFKDENGEQLESKSWNQGQTPSYNYQKADTAEWDYTVQGWSLTQGGDVITIPAVSADATYYAVVSKAKQKYALSFDTQGGSSMDSITKDYGSQIAKPNDPKKDGYKFSGWSYDKAGSQAVEWPMTITANVGIYANWNEVVDIKGYLATMVGALDQGPMSYIPDAMKADYSANHVTQSQVTYDFTQFTNVSNIKYGGHGEQWHMVLDNLNESQRFYAITTAAEALINSSVILFNNYLDSNPGSTADHSLNETTYSAKIHFASGKLDYVLQYKTGFNVPFFGEVLPQIAMSYNVASGEKTVRIQLSENNAMRYVVSENHYAFAIEYGVEIANRKAYFQVDRLEDDSVQGHIYEFVQLKGKDMVPACADFYIGEDYVSVVGNKASGIPGFSGFINELYKTDQGKLLGYEIREEFEKWSISATYHTLWFNLSDINGINNIKAIPNGSDTYGLGGVNNHDIYLNNSASVFEPTYNKKLLVNTSRKYDVEMRKQYFYGYVDEKLTEFEVSIPMMFIQADHDGYTNFTDFPTDIKSKSGITASVSLSSTYLDKIQSDYATLVDVFIGHKEQVTGDTINDFIGEAEEIAS